MLERLSIYSDWAVGTARNEDREAVKVTGAPLVDLVEGAEYEFRGRPSFHRQHGEGFAVEAVVPHIRPDRKSIVKFMTKNWKSLSEQKANKFVDQVIAGAAGDEEEAKALEALRQQLLAAPWSLDLSTVAKRAEFKTDETASAALAFLHRDLATRLTGMPGIRDNVLKALASHLLAREAKEALSNADNPLAPSSNLDPRLLEKCWARLIKDPYEPMPFVAGYGFGTADAIGAASNIPRDAPERLRALVLFALDQECTRSGHTYLTRNQFIRAIERVDAQVPAQRAIEHGLEADLIEMDEGFGERRFYTPDLLDAERSLAARVAEMCAPVAPMTKAPRDKVIAKIKEVTARVAPGTTLDDSQLAALVGILTSKKRLHTLTAGPGCGKTALMEILTCVLKSRDFVFCGPTGKSAKVLNNRLSKHGRSAATVHSTLAGGSRKDFTFNEDNPLPGNILVLDESGMADNDLADGVLAAAKEMHVILLGDHDQLPSVSPGQFLKDILAIDGPDHHRLTTTHRNGGGILDIINQVRDGEIDCADRPDVQFSHHLGEAAAEFPRVAQQYVNAVDRHGFDNVILLIPKRQGNPDTPGWNTTYANARLREMCNPNAEKVPGTGRLHVGDRIIIRANMKVPLAGTGGRQEGRGREDDDECDANEVRVVNGDTGSIVAWQPYRQKQGQPRRAGAQYITLRLDDGRTVDFPGTVTEVLQHSYALSVHSGQGSEYAHVIMVAPQASRGFVNRPMLFTGLSRARHMLEVHGEDRDLMNIAATPAPARNSALPQRVRRLLGQPEEATQGQSTALDEDPGDFDDAYSGVPCTPVPPSQMSARARRYSQGDF
ncbi:AAA family ATPase [Ramlibacter sp. AN1133]|uniref:AAA family ATPase n=1 Tax=Ramlibacter sp. AN1133 TaxID=3133429 RepID=UPI0030BAEBBE